MHRLFEVDHGLPQERPQREALQRHKKVRRGRVIGVVSVPQEKTDKAGGGAVDRPQEQKLAPKIPTFPGPHLRPQFGQTHQKQQLPTQQESHLQIGQQPIKEIKSPPANGQ